MCQVLVGFMTVFQGFFLPTSFKASPAPILSDIPPKKVSDTPHAGASLNMLLMHDAKLRLVWGRLGCHVVISVSLVIRAVFFWCWCCGG